ncbi:hypothetical protein E2C01_047246 [Portunus trituberculatus]|uniref:Uncharacterized protein n=1 Tax=Portunus trituberculatus TaxID=210409 RepID=A0A5B7G726_PORTR|nr:hypothetical protein [Portunus trituberculatus]
MNLDWDMTNNNVRRKMRKSDAEMFEDASLRTKASPDENNNSNNNNNKSVKFRGSRAAFMHPTAIVFSPPIKSSETPQQPSQHFSGSSSSSSLPSPGGFSSSPSTYDQLHQHSRGIPSMATPAVTPGPFIPRQHTWEARSHGFNSQGTGFGFAMNRAHLRPANAQWDRSRNPTLMEGSAGWAGMKAPPVQTRWPRTQHTPDTSDSDSSFVRHDTFGHQLKEDLSHRQNRYFQERMSVQAAWMPEPRIACHGKIAGE